VEVANEDDYPDVEHWQIHLIGHERVDVYVYEDECEYKEALIEHVLKGRTVRGFKVISSKVSVIIG
jgi:predicted GNAT family N-acyltransferase